MQLNSGTRTVEVGTSQIADANGNLIFEVGALCGSSVSSGRKTFQPNANITQAQLQAELDSFRQQIADEAAGKENLKALAELVT